MTRDNWHNYKGIKNLDCNGRAKKWGENVIAMWVLRRE